jgi:hypothetical protein
LHSRSFRFPSSKRWPNFRCWGNDQIDSDRTESDRILFLSSSFIILELTSTHSSRGTFTQTT